MKYLFLCACLPLALAALAVPPRGGIFIPRNSGYEGRVGLAHALFSRIGGVMSVVTGEFPAYTTLSSFDLVFSVQRASTGKTVTVRQSFDRAPIFDFLEEGNDRIGLRVRFKLYDADDAYLGHGMTETWLYPNGELFVTVGASFEGEDPVRVTEAYLEDRMAPGYDPAPGVPRAIPVEDNVPASALFVANGLPGQTIYWRSKHKGFNTVVPRAPGGGAPIYWRWPDYFCQAYGGGAYPKELVAEHGQARFNWPVDEKTKSFNALFRIAAPVDEAQAKGFVAAEKDLVKLAVTGGVVHGNQDGYNDTEGAYEVRKAADPLVITLPADPLGRTIRVKAIALTKSGAVTTVLDGKPLVPHLSTDGGIADDPLAPIHEQPEGAADMAMVTVRLTDRPQTLTVREVDGVQYVYQTRDAWREFDCFTSKTGPRYAGFRFSLIDGHARNMRRYGRADWALGENLLTWFSFCGYTPDQVMDQLRDFEILKNGPDEAIFRYVSETATGSARSEYIVRVPANSPAMRIDVTASVLILDRWPFTGVQFFDVFPFRGVWPRDWWYNEILFMARDGRWKTENTLTYKFEGDTKLETFSGGGFFALYSSDRGNMLMLTKNFKPELPVEHVICGNYIDYHMTLEFPKVDGKPAFPEKGFTASMQYQLAVWGDSRLTRKELIDIGKKSMQANELVIPAK